MLLLQASEHVWTSVWTHDELDRLRAGDLAAIDLHTFGDPPPHVLLVQCVPTQADLEDFAQANSFITTTPPPH